MDVVVDFFWIFGVPLLLLCMLVVSHVVKRRRARRLTEFARSHGWTCQHSWGLTGPGAKFIIRPEHGDRWELRVRRSSAGRRSRVAGKTEFRAPEPHFVGGFAMFVSTGGKDYGLYGLAKILRVFGIVFGKRVMRWLFGAELGESMHLLQAFEAPPGIDLGIFATADPRDKFDLKSISRAVHRMSDRYNFCPSVRIGNGLQVVEEGELGFPGSGEAFIAGCLELCTALGPLRVAGGSSVEQG
jgi:hypothetical protein